MKKIRCGFVDGDFLKVKVCSDFVLIDEHQSEVKTRIALSPAKIRKLRKQLKRALIAIEGDEAAHDHP